MKNIVVAIAAMGLLVGCTPKDEIVPVSQPSSVEASPSPSPTPRVEPTLPTGPIKVVFVGDSYTNTFGFPPTWAFRLSNQMGWDEVDVAYGGTGYFQFYGWLPLIEQEDPAIVFVLGGTNDILNGPSGLTDHKEWSNVVHEFYTELRGQLPEARIVAISPMWGAWNVTDEMTEIRDVIRREAEAIPGGCYVDLQDPFTYRLDLLREDQIHPNDAGHELIKDLVLENFGHYCEEWG